jgi:cobalt-zinc-cadmium efflux system outer membrane protein
MEQQLLELGRQAGELVVDTKSAYYASVAAHESHVTIEAGVALARRSLDAVRLQVDKGVATETDAGLALRLALSADLAARQARRAEVGATRRLAGLLSLTNDLVELPLTDPLPVPDSDMGTGEALIEHALRSRLDQAAVAAAITSAEERVALEQNNTGPEFTAGVEYERPEGDSRTVLGPAVGVTLPIFDNNEAQISRAEFELAQLRRLGEAMRAELVQEVRAAVDELAIARDASSFVAGEVLPQAERLLELAQRAYDGGGTTLLTLLEAESAVLETRSTSIATRLDAALALVELERALGGPLPEGEESPARR